MRYILKVVREVEAVYDRLDREALYFKANSGLKCTAGCSSCCNYKNIKASVLELLPLAWHLYMNDQHHEVLQLLDQKPSFCVNYRYIKTDERMGGCLYYDQRPLICRLFGNSGVTVKQGLIAIYTCRIMKEADPQIFEDILRRVNGELVIPMAQHYQTRLDAIDYALASDIHPINISLLRAMDKVSYHFRGQPNPQGFKKVG